MRWAVVQMTATITGRRATVIVAITEYLPMDVASTGTRVPKHGPAQGVPCEVEIHYSTHARPYWDLVEAGHLVAVATDRYRAVVARVPCEGECPPFAVDVTHLRKAIALIRPARRRETAILGIRVGHGSVSIQSAECGVTVPTLNIAAIPKAGQLRKLISDAVESGGPRQDMRMGLLLPLAQTGGAATMFVSESGKAMGCVVDDWLAAAIMPMRPSETPADTDWVGVAE